MDLTAGRRDLPGGLIHTTRHWAVEHCIGPLGVGTLIVKPLRHCEHVWDLTDEEAAELARLLRRVARAIHELLHPDQVYVCLWSHAGWQPGHIHYVLQPVWNTMRERYPTQGPALQVAMFSEDAPPPCAEVEAFAAKTCNALLRPS